MTRPADAIVAAPRRRRSRRGGFTLIEVLTSILLLAIVVPVAMQAATQAMRMADTAKQRSTAAALAESELAQLIATGDWQNGSLSGTFDGDYANFTWQAVVGNWTQENVQTLDVIVSWPPSRPNENNTRLVVSTLVYLSNDAAAAASGAATGGTTP